MERIVFVQHAELAGVMRDIAAGGADVFCELQPRLYEALQVPAEPDDELNDYYELRFTDKGDNFTLFQSAVEAASKGLGLVA